MVDLKHRPEPYEFCFDWVLPDTGSQKEVFDSKSKESIIQLVLCPLSTTSLTIAAPMQSPVFLLWTTAWLDTTLQSSHMVRLELEKLTPCWASCKHQMGRRTKGWVVIAGLKIAAPSSIAHYQLCLCQAMHRHSRHVSVQWCCTV